MPNAHLEQDLVDSFVDAIGHVDDAALSVGQVHNQNCRSRTYADIEFTSESGQRWAIEAKYGAESDKANEVHKLFGDLLRETGRDNRTNCRIGLLLPGVRRTYYGCSVQKIDRPKFLQFGALVPVDTVFVLHESGHLDRLTWQEFYDGQSTPP